MLDIVHGHIVKRSGRKCVRREMVITPSDAPLRSKKYTDRALQALPVRVDDMSDREDRCIGLAFALIAELAELPREEANNFAQRFASAYHETVQWYVNKPRRCA